MLQKLKKFLFNGHGFGAWLACIFFICLAVFAGKQILCAIRAARLLTGISIVWWQQSQLLNVRLFRNIALTQNMWNGPPQWVAQFFFLFLWDERQNWKLFASPFWIFNIPISTTFTKRGDHENAFKIFQFCFRLKLRHQLRDNFVSFHSPAQSELQRINRERRTWDGRGTHSI